MGGQTLESVPVSMVLLDNGRNLTFSGTLVLSGNNSSAEAEPTKVPYDGKGAGLFTVIVITVYGISIVCFIASFIKRKKGIMVEADEHSTVTQYLTQVPDLKEKTARDHFKKLKMGIIEKVERGIEEGKEENLSFANKFRDKRLRSPAEMRQPLLKIEENRPTCIGCKEVDRLETCSKLVEALHSIKEVDEVGNYSRSCFELQTLAETENCEALESMAGTPNPKLSGSTSTHFVDQGKRYTLSAFSRQNESGSKPSTGPGIFWEGSWDKRNGNFSEGHVNLAICDKDEDSNVPLLPLPPPPPFHFGYTSENICDSNEDQREIIIGQRDLRHAQAANLFKEISIPKPVVEYAPPKRFRGRNWPPSPSLGQAARARLAPKCKKLQDDDWEEEDFDGPNGFSLKVWPSKHSDL